MKYFTVENREFYSSGRVIKLCGQVNAWYENIDNLDELIISLKQLQERQHIFTFFQRVPHTVPVHNFYMEPYPVGVIKLKSYDDWWKNSIKNKTRQAVKSSEKKGITVDVVNFDDEFIKGISAIYNESPVRAGKKFPHYNDSLDKVKRENGTFINRSVFIGAYYRSELVGFAKIVFEADFVDILQLLAKITHRDKCVTNALIAKIVAICSERGVEYISYDDLNSSSLSDFKRHNGFLRMELPRYYVPLNIVGAVAIKLKLHRPLSQWFPERMLPLMRDLRKQWYERRLKNLLIVSDQK